MGVMGNLHYQKRHGENPLNAYTKHGVDVREWHTYRVDWMSNGMAFYIDDTVVGSVPARSSYADWPYNTNEYYIILNLAMGGSLGGICLDDTTKPQCSEFLDVDWVRVSAIE